MFLAWNEIKQNKLRFILISSVLLLIAYLVFFLSGLVNGLANMNREAVDKWQADAIILTDESDKSLPQSILSTDDVSQVKNANHLAPIAQINAIASRVSDEDTRQGVAIFAVQPDDFIAPNITDGHMFERKGDVVAADYLKSEGFKVGDKVKLSSSDEYVTIVGFTDHARFNAAPVLYTSFETMQQIKGLPIESDPLVNAVVVQSENISTIKVPTSLEVVETETFIEKLPGYAAQNITLTLMIAFLIVISSVIIAIFLYVLTVQKASMFGVLKAQGISNAYLARSVVAQTFILTVVGVALGFALTWLTGAFLPYKVPVQFDILSMLIYALIFIIVAILGAVFSVLSIFKIDPLKAIGG